MVQPYSLSRKVKSMHFMSFDGAEWMLYAECREKETSVFFNTEIIANRRNKNRAMAVSICKECSVREECLEYAIRNDIHHGTWGGLSEVEIFRLRSKRDRNLGKGLR